MINRRRVMKAHRLKESLCDRCVDVHQRRVASTANPRMKWKTRLYALVCETTGAPVYIGKAGRCPVRHREYALDKEHIARRLVESSRFRAPFWL